MKNIPLLLVVLLGSVAFAQVQPKENWWRDEPYRLIQTNLREIDAIDFDLDVYVNSLKEVGASIVLINVGGIVANYYTDLDYHYQNPNLKFDIIEEVIGRLHDEGIRVMGRFDFSKLNEEIALKHEDWLYKSETNEIVNYNGQVHTCVNGKYQQEHMLSILDEALTKFPLDGVFFNMIGYGRRDYSNNYHGICQSDACRKGFRDWSGGLELPPTTNANDPTYLKYVEFTIDSKADLFGRVNELIKSHGEQVAICTYTYTGTDFYRTEANSHASFYNNETTWEYKSSSNVKRVLGSWDGKLSSNAAVHFYGYPARHSADSRWLIERRLFQNIMHGAGLDFYCIGRLDNLEDRKVLENVTDVFQFHLKHEDTLFQVHSGNRILVLLDKGMTNEYKGLFNIMSENHLLFDVMEYWCVGDDDNPRDLAEYELIVLPGISKLSDKQCALLDGYVANGGKLLATGFVSMKDGIGNPINKIRLKSLGVKPEYTAYDKAMGVYYRISEEDKKRFSSPDFDDIDILYAWEKGLHCELEPSATGLLKFIPQAMFGPPEKCYYTEVTDIPGLILNSHGKGQTAYLTFNIGSLYNHTRNEGHGLLLKSTITDLLGFEPRVWSNAGPLVEISRQISDNEDYEWYGLLNLSGQMGPRFSKPMQFSNFNLSFKWERPIAEVTSLQSGEVLPYTTSSDGSITVRVPQLDFYDVVLVNYE